MSVMERIRALFAAIIAGALLLLPARTSRATTCVTLPIKPIRHDCAIVINELGERVSNAEVTILRGETGFVAIQTHADGKFSFEPLDAGKHDIRVQANNYKTAQSPIVIVKPQTKCKRALQIMPAVGIGCFGISLMKT